VIYMQNYANGPEIPMGLGMALAQNREAMNHYAGLSKAEQEAIIKHTQEIRSKQEMEAYVQSLVQ